MRALRRTCIRMVMISLVVGLAAGCGSDSDAVGDAAAEQQDNRDDEQLSEEDCADDQYWHPLAQECRDEDDGSNAQDCDEDEEFDPDTGECVSKCGVNEAWNPDEQECEQLSEQCGEFEEWDDEEGVCVPTGECGPGDIIGQSCRPDGGVLPGAQVTVEGLDCDGHEFSETTTADDQGNYEFYDIPAGNHDLIFSSGSWEHTEDVIVHNGETTDLTSEAAKKCLESTEMDIAIILGQYDDIGEILEGMGVDYTAYSSSSQVDDLVSDLDALKEYDILFAECSFTSWGMNFDTDTEIVESNIRRFVHEGNSLYASDLADPWIEKPLPDAVDFSDASGNSQTVTADVVSSPMQDLLGSTETEISFDLPGWTVADDGGDGSIVHFEADIDATSTSVDDAALMVQYNDPIGGGRALYTSFHNTAQPTGDMEDILEYMIFQL